ncbi:DNA-binding response regulator [Actinoplanes missouriensis]|uniref:DNA-binding response regulator n=1 Tax=Actinoplanes missouriensis TaxID=1866 RepID=UPI0033F06DFF
MSVLPGTANTADDRDVRVAVVDPLPMYRHGVAALLAAAGHEVDTPADALGWARRHTGTAVLLTVGADDDWQLLGRLAAIGRRTAVIAVLSAPGGPNGADAVRAGAASVIGRAISPEALLRVISGLSAGEATLPLDLLRSLAAGPDAGDDADRPPPDQIAWLRRLAGGSTVAALAGDVGYSERAMFRLLQGLYERIGVRTRTEALMRAHDRGWLRG